MAIEKTEMTSEQLEEQANEQSERFAADGVEDALQAGEAGAEDQGDAPQHDDEPLHRKVPMSPSDALRAQIAARFKRDDDRPFNGDMTDPQNLYGEIADPEEVQPDPAAAEPGVPAAAPAPKTVTLKILGKDVTMTEEEALRRASMVSAADSYLEEARSLLHEAKTIKAERAGRDRQNPDGQSSTQDDEQDQPTSETHQNPDDELGNVVEKIQFGDPKEAARDLRKFIKAEASKEANEGHLQRLVNQDLAASQKALQDFTAANPDIAKDQDAALLMENKIYQVYRDEIKALGMDEAKIPTNPKELADWHRFYRMNGHAVSKVPDVLEKAKAHVVARLFASKAPPQSAKPRGENRVEVNVNRTERRANIPNQPTRAVAPRRDVSTATSKTSPSDVVAQMRRARGQLNG